MLIVADQCADVQSVFGQGVLGVWKPSTDPFTTLKNWQILLLRITGIAQARKRGQRHGRPPTVAPRVRDVQHLYATGLSKSAIARRLGISRTSVRRLIGATAVALL
jgi:DNA-binding NarL/FixJ family response regulator